MCVKGADIAAEISIHALLAESDQARPALGLQVGQFLSTLSLRRATPVERVFFLHCGISIHALLAESDVHRRLRCPASHYFYPRSPCGERHAPAQCRAANFDFYPRSPCGERRWNCTTETTRSWHFYPRSPCGERQLPGGDRPRHTGISIHALLAESDISFWVTARPFTNFYPRSPCGERRGSCPGLAGGSDFYPRSPCGERPPNTLRHCTTYLFLSTLSLRRATIALFDFPVVPVISIHALLAESDAETAHQAANGLAFLSTLSLRRATVKKAITFYPPVISIHALLAESDRTGMLTGCVYTYFYPRSPCGERRTQT